MTHADEQIAALASQNEHYKNNPREDATPDADDLTPNWEAEYRKLARQLVLVSQAITDEAKRGWPDTFGLNLQRNNWWSLETRKHSILTPRLRKAVSMVNETVLSFGLKL